MKLTSSIKLHLVKSYFISILIDFLAFSRSNVLFFISPPFAIGSSLYFSNRKTFVELLWPFTLSFLYAYLFILQFNISNDITGIDADRIDKPMRPIPSNRITISRAWFLYSLAVFLFGLFSYLIGHFTATLSWILLTIVLNFTAAHKSSALKNGLLVPGNISLLTVVWCLMNNVSDVYHHPQFLWNVTFNSCLIGVLLLQQDMRDVEGDKALNRRTLSVVLGNQDASKFIAKACFCALLTLVLETIIVNQVRVVSKLFYISGATILYGIMIIRNWFCIEPKKTYEYFFHFTFFWHCLMMPIEKE